MHGVTNTAKGKNGIKKVKIAPSSTFVRPLTNRSIATSQTSLQYTVLGSKTKLLPQKPNIANIDLIALIVVMVQDVIPLRKKDSEMKKRKS